MNNRLKVKIVGKLPIVLEEFIGYIHPNLVKDEDRRMPTCNQLDLQILRSQPIMPKILRDH